MKDVAEACGVALSGILMTRAVEKLRPDLLHAFEEPTDPNLHAQLLATVMERFDQAGQIVRDRQDKLSGGTGRTVPVSKGVRCPDG